MKELDFLKIISEEIGNKYIGDDCAYLPELGIVISQDSLIEKIHFRREWCTPYQLGYKSAAVNISDILASGAIPKYLTVALSLTDDIDEKFVKEFYKGVRSVSKDINIIGGDITGSQNDIAISITAIGITANRNISSRKNAKPGYAVITKGLFGASAAGLVELSTGGNNKLLIKSHLEPELEFNFSNQLATIIKGKYAMMDSSDGLTDALFKIAEASNVTLDIDYNLIPRLDCVQKEQVLYGGEDYKLIACVPRQELNKIRDFVCIGEVTEYKGYRVRINDLSINNYEEIKSYNHFSG